MTSILLSAGIALAAGTAPGSSALAAERSLAGECAAGERGIGRLSDLGGYVVREGEARLPASVWAGLSRSARAGLIRGLASSASCAADRRDVFPVTILDLEERLLVRQLVSTELECHGDTAEPQEIWYPC